MNFYFVKYVGTDEATTCVGLVIRNRSTGMTSVAHMDFPRVVDGALSQMLSLIVDRDCDAEFDVFSSVPFFSVLYECCLLLMNCSLCLCAYAGASSWWF